MSLIISPIRKNDLHTNFASSEKYRNISQDKNEENPISRKGEAMNLVKMTFLGGLALGARLLWELVDCEFLFEHAEHQATKLVDKNKRGVSSGKRDLLRLGGTFGLITAGVSAFALLYTMLNVPKIAYKSKVNSFQKGKEMDVYVKANEIEKNIYNELSERGKIADDVEREHLKEQYMQMKMAKNQLPDFVTKKQAR